MTVGLEHFLVVAALLFGIGFYTVVTRKNAVAILMGVEIILNAANLNFVAFSRYAWGGTPAALAGQVIPVFVIMIAAAEAAVGLAIVLAIFSNWRTIDTGVTTSLRD
ncbi:MAG: NADH-quinone oxidoreductase subunit K [Deltaproteobacteria bacterium RIFOXYA12_FULL_58_15]|nr:MAG: NADH-quinone oxidoreductase subunit K [Deltaproteobacteria bacterium RIFOXYA12_FULL_58_15]